VLREDALHRLPGSECRQSLFLVLACVALLAMLQLPNAAAAVDEIAWDSTSAATEDPVTGDDLSWLHTVGVGSNRILVVGVSFRRTGGENHPDDYEKVSTMTFGSSSLTKIGSADSTDRNQKYRVELWRLIDPPTGTDIITVDFDVVSSVEYAVGAAASFFGVHQTTPTGTFAGAGGETGTPTVEVASAVGEVVIDCVATKGQDGNFLTAGSGQAERWNLTTGQNTSSHLLIGAGSTEPGAATVAMSWTPALDKHWSLGAVSLKPAVVTGEIEVGRGAAPAIAADLGGSGNFLIAWEEAEPGGSVRSSDAILARLFDSHGMPVGIEFVVSGDDGQLRGETDVASTAGGDFVVTWHGDEADGDSLGIVARRFSSSGMPVGVEFVVNSSTDLAQSDPAIAADGDGFVVVWVDQTGSGIWEHALRRFDAAGMPVGVELRFGDPDIVPTPPSLAVSPTGGLLVVWESPTDRISGQLFSPSGMPVGVEFQVDSGSGTASGSPSAAWEPPGSYLVAWQNDSDGDGNGIFARRLDSAGMPVGVEFQVNSVTAGEQVQPDVAVDTVGEFVIVWQSDDADGRGIAGQRFAPSGMPVGVELQLNRSQAEDQSRPGAAYARDGLFYVAWESEDTTGDGFTEIVAAEPAEIHRDDFESGTTSAWASRSP
jgi:hypothetical protein